jgi:threonine aldolase
MNIIDLRSDTVTLPTPQMLEAMRTAELGDDVFCEDPTVNKLEEIAARRMGKEAALFVPSGTMANLVSVLVHCSRGQEVILGDLSHIFLNEAGGISSVGGIHPHTIPNLPDGTMRPQDIKNAIRGDNVHFPRTSLICLENTHNRCSGSPLTPEYMAVVGELARESGLSVHLDGARIFNAAIALGVDVRDLTKNVESVSFCLSKGLCAPVGSLVCGTKEFISESRRNRKLLGGGMRQVGVIAAAGIVALDSMADRLKEDHENAQRLVDGLNDVSFIEVDESVDIRTNILYVDLVGGTIGPNKFLQRLVNKGLKVHQTGRSRFRMVTHHGISSKNIDDVIEIITTTLS